MSKMNGRSFATMPLAQRSVIFFALTACLWLTDAGAQENFTLRIRSRMQDRMEELTGSIMRSAFSDSTSCAVHIDSLPSRLVRLGFLEASVDSIWWSNTCAEVLLHLGPRYRWRQLRVDSALADSLRNDGWAWFPRAGDLADLSGYDNSAEAWVNAMGTRGFPFASIRLDSLQMTDAYISARLLADRGPLYRIDSITIDGKLKIRTGFLYRYLDIPRGSIYRTDRLAEISGRLSMLPFLQEERPWEIVRTGTGAALNLHLEPKKSNRIDGLIAFLPSNSQVGGKLLMAGEANLDLHNALGTGERLIANWQQLQVGSPRLQMAFEQPYILGSRFEGDVRFMLFRKDSSFLNMDLSIGARYMLTPRRKGGVFYQRMSTTLLTVDTNKVRSARSLPEFIDLSADLAGLSLEDDLTDRPLNPRRGLTWRVNASAGIRKVRQNPVITALKQDASGTPFDFSTLYDPRANRRPVFRARMQSAAFLPIGRQAAVKFGMQGGVVLLKDPFRNELFQIGGYRTLRGFDEERIFSSAFGIGTVEFRWLTGPLSHFFAFTDIGYSADRSLTVPSGNAYGGVGLGLRLETRAGLLDLAYAVGKRDGQALDLRQSKIHFGIVSLF
jgi:outer membrane protein assembly factor BamA